MSLATSGPTAVSGILDAIANPATRHALTVHLPIALALGAAGFSLAAAISGGRRRLAAWACALQALLGVVAWLTTRTGEAAESRLPLGLPEAAYDAVEAHAGLAEKVWIFALVACVLLALTLRREHALAAVARWGAAAISAAACLFIAVVAHRGGVLVYTFGLGTPAERGAVATPAGSAGPQDTVDARAEFFRVQVAPLISQHCAECHNPAKVRRGDSGRLDLTTIAGVLKGGKDGPVVVPGHPQDSLLIRRVRSQDADEVMPAEGRRLTEDEIRSLERWITDGAVWGR